MELVGFGNEFCYPLPRADARNEDEILYPTAKCYKDLIIPKRGALVSVGDRSVRTRVGQRRPRQGFM